MPQEGDLRLEEETLLQRDPETVAMEDAEDGFQILAVLRFVR